MKPEFLLLIGSVLGVGFDYNSEIDYKYASDEKVNECLMQMYFYMLTGDDRIFNEFHELYQKLDFEKQEYVKQDYINIIREQEKEKVFRKKREE